MFPKQETCLAERKPFADASSPALLGLLTLLPLVANAAYRFDVPDYLARLPEQTYRIVEHNFSTLYQQTDFTPRSPAATSTVLISTSLSECRWPSVPSPVFSWKYLVRPITVRHRRIRT